MRKITTMALAGLMLSTTILGAATPVIAAKNADPIPVTDETGKQAKALTAVSELGDTDVDNTDTDKTDGQRLFDDLKDGATLDVVPVFKEDAPTATKYQDLLQKAIGIVDKNKQEVPMTIKDHDKTTGFASVVSYTSNGETKTFNLKYNYYQPSLHTEAGFENPLIFQADNMPDNFNNIITSGENLNNEHSNVVKDANKNKTDLNGHVGNNQTTITQKSDDIEKKGGTVTFTPEDITYKVKGEPFVRQVKVYDGPDWSKLNKTIQLDKNNKLDLNNYQVLSDDNGNKYRISIDSKTVDVTKAGQQKVDFVAHGIKDDGTDAIQTRDHLKDTPVEYTLSNQTLTVSDNTEQVNYNVLIVDKNTGKIVGSQAGQAANGSTQTVDPTKVPAGYTLTDAQKNFTVDAQNPTKVITVAKTVPYEITFVDKNTNTKVGDVQTGNGEEGSDILLNAPENYEFVNSADMMFKLSSDTPKKTIYVKSKKLDLQNLNYTIQYKDADTDKVVGKTTGKGNFSDFIKATAPKGYSITDLKYQGFVLTKDKDSYVSYVKKADTNYQVTYIDQANDQEVGTETGKAAQGAIVTLTAPKGYIFTTASDVTLKVDKNSGVVKIYVKKSDATETNLITTYPDSGYVAIYNENGKLNNDVVLSQNSDWVIDQTKTIDGVTYYRVATNQYVRASSVYKYQPFSGVVTTSKETAVYNSKGQLVIDRALDKNTPWYTDRTSEVKGEKMYRVATDEWVRASDITVN